jgi:GT2 family glycosyltransferase
MRRACNRAVSEARGDLLVFTDDDVIADPGWLIELWEGASRWPARAVFGGRILPRWPAGCRPDVRHPFLRHAYAIADWDRPEGGYAAGYVFGPNMAIRARLFRSGWCFRPDIGPDSTETYVPGGETELLRRLEQAGFPPVYLPRALVFHQIRAERPQMPWLYGRAFRKGRWDQLKLGPPGGPRLGGVPWALPGETGLAYLRFLASRRSGDAVTCLDRGVADWRRRGMVHQCRTLARA